MSWDVDGDRRSQEDDPWASIVDLMSAFALVLFLAVTFFILNFNMADQKLKQKERLLLEQQRLLSNKEKQLHVSQRLLSDKEKQLHLSVTALRIKDKDLLSSQNMLVQLQQKMAELKQQEQKLLEEKQALAALNLKQQRDKDEMLALLKQKDAKERSLATLISKQHQLVERQKEETQKQKTFFEQASASRDRCEHQLQSLLKQQKDVLTAIYRVFSARQQKTGAVGFDPNTGKFRLGGDILFSEGKSLLTDGGKVQLRQVLQALDKVLLQPNIRPLIAGIMIEGHTNQRGRAERNWELSSQRSLAALQYMLSLAPKNSEKYRIYSSLFFAGAFGPFRPLQDQKGEVDQIRSRRIEIKVLFHDQQRLQGILQQLQQTP